MSVRNLAADGMPTLRTVRISMLNEEAIKKKKSDMPLLLMRMWLNPMARTRTVDAVKPDS